MKTNGETRLNYRIAAAVKHSQKLPTEVAKLAGMSDSALSQLIAGKSKTLKAQTAMRLAAVTGVRVGWLVNGDGPMCDTGVVAVTHPERADSGLFLPEPLTRVHANNDGQIVVEQPETECSSCGATHEAFVYFSPDRARKVAAEILRLADELGDS